MIGTALGFGGRIGRLRYFLLSIGLGFAMAVLTLTLFFALAPGRAEMEAAGGEPPEGMILKIAVIVLPVYLWATAALATKRFRDIGWKPLWLIPGWVLAVVLDTVVATAVPALAIGEGDQTALGLIINLAMFGALLFWPGREGDHQGPDIEKMRQAYRESARSQAAPAPRRDAIAGVQAPAGGGFGRRRA